MVKFKERLREKAQELQWSLKGDPSIALIRNYMWECPFEAVYGTYDPSDMAEEGELSSGQARAIIAAADGKTHGPLHQALLRACGLIASR